MKIELDNAVVYHGSNLDVLPTLPDNSVDSIVTDPPYELGFMGKSWDSSGIAYSVELWRECMRVLKPGGHLLAFGGSRTWHRLAVAIEDAGFEMRDSIAWLYGSGFPKSLDVSKAIDKANGKILNLSEFTLWMRTTGLTVKQVTETLRGANLISANGTMASHYFAKSESAQPAIPTVAIWKVLRPLINEVPNWVDEMIERIEAERKVIGQKLTNTTVYQNIGGQNVSGEVDITAPATPEAKQWQGWGTALKPAFEPVVVARKPLIGTVAQNVLTYGTGGLNIDVSRIGTEGGTAGAGEGEGARVFGNGLNGERGKPVPGLGRWPANIILDPYTAELLDKQAPSTGAFAKVKSGHSGESRGIYGDYAQRGDDGATFYGDGLGGASRFFYVAKASKRDRNEGLDHLEIKRPDDRTETGMGSFAEKGVQPGRNFHPTVKPTSLMEYLIKLVTPEGGTVLDPFTGSGSTGKAALLNGYKFIGIELTADYWPIIEGRLRWANEQRQAQANQTEQTEKETLF